MQVRNCICFPCLISCYILFISVFSTYFRVEQRQFECMCRLVELFSSYISLLWTPARIQSLTKALHVGFYSFLKNYSTSASNILRWAFFHHYLQTVQGLFKSVDIVFCVLQKVPDPLKTLDTVGSCRRLVFTVNVTNLWKFELNQSSKLWDNNERKKHPCHTFWCLILRPQILNLRSRDQIRWKLLLSRKLRYFRGSRFSQCFILKHANNYFE